MKKKILELTKKVIDNKNINEKSKLLDEGWLDSLSTIVLIQEIEEKFKIEISQDYLNHDNFNSVNNISNLVQKIINERNT